MIVALTTLGWIFCYGATGWLVAIQCVRFGAFEKEAEWGRPLLVCLALVGWPLVIAMAIIAQVGRFLDGVVFPVACGLVEWAGGRILTMGTPQERP
jgi:hypothetical protein